MALLFQTIVRISQMTQCFLLWLETYTIRDLIKFRGIAAYIVYSNCTTETAQTDCSNDAYRAITVHLVSRNPLLVDHLYARYMD